MNKYTKLNAVDREDIEKIREYAEAMNDYLALKRQMDYVQQILNDNQELRGSIWTTEAGVARAITDLEDDHLKNISSYLAGRGQSNARIRKEYIKRFGEAPALPSPNVDDDYMF